MTKWQAPAPVSPLPIQGHRPNELDKIGTRKRVLRVWQTAYLSSVGRHIQYMQFGQDGLRPLIWLHSVEYPMSPPWGFCVDAADKGYGIVAVRRPGFGETGPAESLDEEVRMLTAFLDESGLDNAVMIVEGTARPAGIRLAMSSRRIAFTLLARPGYVAEGFGTIDPWFENLILQTMQTPAGARLSMAAINQLGRTAGHRWLYENFLKVPADTQFIQVHERDLADAWTCLSSVKAETFRRELRALEPDPLLSDGALAGFPGLAVIGAETPDAWKTGFKAKSDSLGIRTAVLPDGSLFAVHRNVDAVLRLIEENA